MMYVISCLYLKIKKKKKAFQRVIFELKLNIICIRILICILYYIGLGTGNWPNLYYQIFNVHGSMNDFCILRFN